MTETKTMSLRMAKASKDDIQSIHYFLRALQAIADEYSFNLKEYENDKDIYPILQQFCHHLPEFNAVNKGYSEKYLSLENVLHYFNENVSHKFFRVMLCADILIEQACDPAKDHLAYHPELLAPQQLLTEMAAFFEKNPTGAISTSHSLYHKLKELTADDTES